MDIKEEVKMIENPINFTINIDHLKTGISYKNTALYNVNTRTFCNNISTNLACRSKRKNML